MIWHCHFLPRKPFLPGERREPHKTQKAHKAQKPQEVWEMTRFTWRLPKFIQATTISERRDSLGWSCLWIVQGAPGIVLSWAVTHAGVGFSVVQPPLSHPRSCWYPSEVTDVLSWPWVGNCAGLSWVAYLGVIRDLSLLDLVYSISSLVTVS